MGYGPKQRQKAIELKAADAKVVLSNSLPLVLKILTSAQLQQVQRVMDAKVVNPAIQQEYREAIRRAIVTEGQDGGNYEGVYYNGQMVLRDVNLARRAERINEQQIPISEADKSIRLDFEKLLAAGALKPTTDNPDEAAYLERVKNTLKSQGVWLRIGQPYVRDTEDPSRHMIDPRTFEVWLSVGPNGDSHHTIPTKDGQLTRETLLGTVIFGAGYWEQVHQGPVQKALEREITRLRIDIEAGMDEHHRLIMRKLDAPIVSGISDTLGGADLPDRSIWDEPHKLLIKAMEMNVGGNIAGSRPYLIVAAIMTRNNAKLLAEYADASEKGAGRAISILKVAKTAGQVAEVGLMITGAGAVIRGGARVAGAGVAEAEVDALAEKVVADYVKKNPGIAADLDKVKWVPGPKGTVLGRGVKANQSTGAGTGWHKW